MLFSHLNDVWIHGEHLAFYFLTSTLFILPFDTGMFLSPVSAALYTMEILNHNQSSSQTHKEQWEITSFTYTTETLVPTYFFFKDPSLKCKFVKSFCYTTSPP